MRIEKIVFAEQLVELPTDKPDVKKIALVNPTLSFGLPYIPTFFTFFVFVMLEGSTEKLVQMKVEILNTVRHKVLFTREFPIEANDQTPLSEVLPPELLGTNFGILVNNIEIEDDGVYEVIVTLPEGVSKSEKLRFVQRRAINKPQ